MARISITSAVSCKKLYRRWTGLIWRTIAREASALLSFAAGTIPKVVIAYVGTMVVGRAADFYYRTGMKPTREQMEQFTRQSMEVLRHLPLPGIDRFFGGKQNKRTQGTLKIDEPYRGPDWPK